MTKKQEREGTQGWEQFLASKQQMLYEFDLAKTYVKSQTVQVAHGKTAEASFRRWLSSFLPGKFGVTSGRIASQNDSFKGKPLPHYDVIIYDQLNSPILWTEENFDYSEIGKIRVIPAEFVRAVIEVKSNLTVDSSEKAIKKLGELKPLLLTPADKGEHTGKLPTTFFTAFVFFELLKENENKFQIIENLDKFFDSNTPSLPCYGGIILKGEGRDINDTGWIRPLSGTQGGLKSYESLLGNQTQTDKREENGLFKSTMLYWTQSAFSMFAFDIIALLEGKFNGMVASSLYGMSWYK